MVKELLKIICDRNGCEGELGEFTRTKPKTTEEEWRGPGWEDYPPFYDPFTRRTLYYRCNKCPTIFERTETIAPVKEYSKYRLYKGKLSVEQLIELLQNTKTK